MKASFLVALLFVVVVLIVNAAENHAKSALRSMIQQSQDVARVKEAINCNLNCQGTCMKRLCEAPGIPVFCICLPFGDYAQNCASFFNPFGPMT